MSALVWYVGQRDPSLTENLTVDGVAFDLSSSTVRFKMRSVAADSSSLKVDAAATITSAVNGAIRYDWAAADVDEAGDYLAWFEVTTAGKVQIHGEFFLEIRAQAPVTRALCSRADVIRLVPGYSDDQNTDGVLEVLIDAESRSAHQMTGREIVALAGNTTRTFDLDARAVRERRLRVGDMTTVTTVTIKDVNGVTLETVAAADRVSVPRVRQEWEPITELWFPPTTGSASNLAVGNVVEVVGVWGFPEIPVDVRQAVAKLVLVRYIADVTNIGSALSDAINEQGFDAGVAFVSAREVLRSYQRSRFA